VTLEPLLKKPLVFDFDDAIWLSGRFGKSATRRIASLATVVIVGNIFLAEWINGYARDVRIIPTAVDTESFKPRQTEEGCCADDTFIVGWIGTEANLPYLTQIERPLKRFLDDHTSAKILVVTSVPPSFSTIPPERVLFLRWSYATAADAVRQMDIGIMPLPDNEWTRGKCSFKMLQYMATGIPAVVSPVGMNSDVLKMGQVGLAAVEDDDWYEALTYFYDNRTNAKIYGQNGRSAVERHFSQQIIAERLAEIFKELA
jgi:glycosyltransferase involved in cell wall biosynthesis